MKHQSSLKQKIAIIVGAGPAGLTAAYELAKRTEYRPIVLEQSQQIGGISQTFNYRGNRIDIGGHRFFSKSQRVVKWWLEFLPLETGAEKRIQLAYQGQQTDFSPTIDENSAIFNRNLEDIFLLRKRKSRILFEGQLYEYPLEFNGKLLNQLGWWRSFKIGLSYLIAKITFLRGKPKNLEQFLVGRFGGELYRTFFASYTKKVWGRGADQLNADWGAQRIKGVSLRSSLWHFLRGKTQTSADDLLQKGVQASLIQQFLYPKYGPGQLWERVAEEIKNLGGEVHMGQKVVGLKTEASNIHIAQIIDQATDKTYQLDGDLFCSTMPIPELIQGLDEVVPPAVRNISNQLEFRHFITVGLLLPWELVKDYPDNWLYVHEKNVKVGRIQFFHNWSPALVADEDHAWLGLEYFTAEEEKLWQMTDDDLLDLAKSELQQLGFVQKEKILDGVVLRMPKAYPAYWGGYERFDQIRNYLGGFSNLFCLGRNGQHRYNNQDHSMLTAMKMVDEVLKEDWETGTVWEQEEFLAS